jgi:hypothetical protein
MNFTPEMMAQKWGAFEDLQEFVSHPLQDGRFSVAVESGRFECLFAAGEEQRLFVLLSGARDPATQSLPKFDRWRWRELFLGSVLYIADPTLYLDDSLHIGWYVGTAGQNWTVAMAELVAAVTLRLGIPTDQVICYGSSAGGFGAIMLAAELGNATAVAVNPQTRVDRYSPRFVKQLLNAAFGGRQLGQLTAEEHRRLSAFDAFERNPYMKCLVVQNLQDLTHYRDHYTPFCTHFDIPLEGGSGSHGRAVSLLFDAESGHGAEPKELAPQLISRALELTALDVAAEVESRMSGQIPLASERVVIRNLPVTEEMIWLDLADGQLAGLDLRGRLNGWPSDSRSSALLLLDFAEPVDATVLRRHRISLSAAGAYVYFDNHVKDSVFSLKLELPYTKVRRIGFRLWGWRKPIAFQDLCITTYGGSLHLTTSRDIWRGKVASNSDDEAIAVDLLTHQPNCGPQCPGLWSGWNNRMDEYNVKSGSTIYGRTDCFHAVAAGQYSYVSAFHVKPAMLKVPRTIDAYFQAIGDKSRNMVRKALREGYHYVEVNADDYIDDVVAVRTSAPIRQGKPVPAYFLERPVRMVYNSGCKHHGDGFYGLFKEGKLVAYITLYFYGELAQVNHILGHADYLKDGIMNLLMYEVVNDLIKNRPWVRAINYLYSGRRSTATGIALFKRSIGFEPTNLVVAHDDPQLSQALEEKRLEKEAMLKATALQQPPKTKPAPKIDSTALGEAVIVEKCFARAEALDTLFGAAGDSDDGARVSRFSYHADGEECTQPGLRDARVVAVDGVDPGNIVQFLSTGLKQLRATLSNGSFLIFDFPRDLEACQRPRHLVAAGADNDATALALPLQPACDYFKRRFKSTQPNVDSVRDGFKGSDFVLRGLADYLAIDGATRSVLLLKKIR